MSPARALAVARVLRNRLHWRLHAGAMRAGDRLPSVRELASEFGVDARTALRACKLLAEEGLIEMRKRSGMYVSLPSSQRPPLSSMQQSVVDLLMSGLSLGIAPPRLPAVLQEHCGRRRVCIACVESNTDHAQAICSFVRDNYDVDVLTATVDDVLADAASALRGADAAVATAFHATELLRAVEPIRFPLFVATVEPEQGYEVMRGLESRPIYVIGTDDRWAERAAEAFENSDIGPNLHVCVVGEDDLDAIPLDAEVFATPAAALRLSGQSIQHRARTLRYTMSAAEARGLISTIVAANAMA